MEEIFDIVDADDRVIGKELRSRVHREGLRHRAVHVLVWNQLGEVFLQQRALTKDCSPGLWDSSSSGHLDSGEAYDACAVRELREELGVVPGYALERLFFLRACAETGNEFCWIYRLHHEGPFVFQASEVRGGGWFCPQSIADWASRRPGDFSSAFLLIWRELQAQDPLSPPQKSC